MKIGIITFHWATNYGAILQSLVLQQVLLGMGHDVKIINYKPKQYEPSIWKFIRYGQFFHLKTYFLNLKKERLMETFRYRFLRCTQRYYSISQLREDNVSYDLLISGSDQVMNPSFLSRGEKGGSTAYFLDFGGTYTKRVTYAMSFGTTIYPEHLLPIVTPLIKRFDALSARETTGKQIFASMGRSDAEIVPDPTILYTANDYDRMLGLSPVCRNMSTSVYMLHNRLSAIRSRLSKGNIHIITSETIENWIQTIKNSQYVITNSFHGMVFCLLYHVPFSIVLQNTRNEGMNDRFYTLLGRLNLQDRIMDEKDFNENHKQINWVDVDDRLNKIRKIGFDYLYGVVK